MRPFRLVGSFGRLGLRGKLLFGLMGLLALWHSGFFLHGYRLTADDVYFTYIAMQGWETVLETSQWIAEGQGRIGFLFLQPLNMFAALMSEFLAWRVAFVALYMLMIWTAFIYAGRVLKLAIAPFAFLVFLALHPLAFEHLPPTSYPLQNTLPFLVLFTCRWAALAYGERGAWMVLNRLLQGVALLATEFALLLGVVMISAEVLARHSPRLGELRNWFRAVFQDPRFWGDVTMITAVVGLYGAYRLAFPSDYEGNSLQGLSNYSAFVYTTWRHVAHGVILPRLTPQLLQTPWMIWAEALVAGVGMYIALHLALRAAGAKKIALGGAISFLLGAMIFVTFPVSASLKQQGWCHDPGYCAYLDSRTTILGVVLLCVLLMNASLFALRGTLFASMLRYGTAGLFAAIFALGGLHNWQVAQEMSPYDRVWQSARTLACVPELAPEEPNRLYALIDPQGVIPFHEAEAPLQFWPLYLEWVRSGEECAKTAILQRSLNRSYLPVLTPDKLQPVGGKEGKIYLGAGWSKMEGWGVWSRAEQAEIFLHTPELAAGDQAALWLDAHMYLDPNITSQRLVVKQGGQTLWEGTRGPADQDSGITIPLLPYDPAQEIITLTLTLPDAQAAPAIGETRPLGIALKGLMLVKE